VSVLLVVLMVWFLVAIVAAAVARTLCAAAARADLEQADRELPRPVGAARFETASTSSGPTPPVVAHPLARH
jgi:hypothetical protein